ncbi:MAG: ABC transporter permease subunit [Gammaproteobacteria bacterium]|nr:ABC transporter permease subunit [Gammaproteobacteria bacterium]
MNQQPTQAKKSVLLPIDHPESIRRWKLRVLKEKLALYGITLGGNSVILAILLIFFYLMYETAPLLTGADIQEIATYQIAQDNRQIKESIDSYYTIEEQGEIAARFSPKGRISFFETRTGKITKELQIAVPAGESVTSFYAADPETEIVGYGLSNGRLIIAQQEYKVTYPNDKRLIIPSIVYPMGIAAIEIDSSGQPLTQIAIEKNEHEITIVAYTRDKRLLLSNFYKPDFFFEEQASYERISSEITLTHSPEQANDQLIATPAIRQILLNKDQENLFISYQDKEGNSLLDYYRLTDKSRPRFMQQVFLADKLDPVSTISYLTGGISILVGQSSGKITQWFPLNNDAGYQLTRIRDFIDLQAPITRILSEMQRKGFVALDNQGSLGIYHTTAEKNLLVQKISDSALSQVAMAPRANYLLTMNAHGQIKFWSVDNEHPEVSWHSIWQKVWYESYPEADYIWQSSSASNDFEPKFSLTPIAFGTLKAAFYSMLFAMPLAIMGAIYTAYFMSSKIRGFVKPTIEIMEALPTVILGFLAGLWLAPLIEDNLPAVFSLLLVLPVSVLLFAWIWHNLPMIIRQEVPEGWEAFIILPVLILVSWGAFALSFPMEEMLFNGDMQSWLTNELGVNFNQRNSIVVGVAMGFAIIPTIFSITEDAIFSVPRHLTFASMALGATRWQTLIRVVILTASPAIFSAVMIGFGRAIGETMIVLMATGNTAVMDFSIFQGMRTLSANIAVEVPESEVASTHFRVLFLAALVLFVFTFMINTIAELIRQRLRKKYSSL